MSNFKFVLSPCPDCKFVGRSITATRLHQRNEHGLQVAVHECKICKYQCLSEQGLASHVKAKHPEDGENVPMEVETGNPKVHLTGGCKKCVEEATRRTFRSSRDGVTAYVVIEICAECKKSL